MTAQPSSGFPYGLVATGIGTMPHTNPKTASQEIVKTLPELPFWPQLPHRSTLEQMAAQFLSELPSVSVVEDAVLIPELPVGEEVGYAVGPQRIPGMYRMLEEVPKTVRGIKGQVTGPLTLGALVRLQGGVRAIDNLEGREWLAGHISGVAAWQERMMRDSIPQTMMFVDEPYLMQAILEEWVTPDEAKALIATSVSRLTGLVGLHVCTTPPWPFLVELPVQVLSFDAYRFGVSMFGATEHIKGFLDRGGAIAWGVVPSESYSLAHTSHQELCALLDHIWRTLADQGVPMQQLVRQSMITPSCGLHRLTPEEAIHALDMARKIGTELRIMMMTHMVNRPR